MVAPDDPQSLRIAARTSGGVGSESTDERAVASRMSLG